MIAAQIGRGYSLGTVKRYYFFELKMKRFVKAEFGKSDIALADINHVFLERFINFMRVVDHNA